MARRLLFGAAVLGSLAVHAVIAGLNPPRAPAPVGGAMAGQVALGTSFADLVAGVMESTRPDGALEEPSLEKVDTVAPPQEEPAPPEPTAQADARPAGATSPARAMPSETAPSAPSAIDTAQPSRPSTLTSEAGDVAIAPPAEASTPPEPAETAPAQTTITQRTAAPTQALAPVEARETVQLTESLRPVSRPPPRQETARPAPAPQAEPARRGNTQVNAARGQSSGITTGRQSDSTGAQQTTARRAGQAEITSYNASVARRVTRAASRLSSRGNRGDVRVAITIAASGGLADVSVVSSSGNRDADALALQAVRRAAPFGPPPQGGTRLRVTVRLTR